MGDAAATAHFSIGSGTKLAMESAIAMANYLHSEPTMAAAFAKYEDARRTEVLRLQSAARNSLEWFEDVERYLHLDPVQFNYSLLTRSQRISHENLRLRDKNWLEGAEAWFQRLAGAGDNTVRRPMFAPFRLRDMRLKNRVVVSPMAQYKAVDGCPTDWHLVHYGERAKGGAGLVCIEMTCVSPEGRITPGCTGMYAPEHEAAWKRIVDFVHAETDAKICCQLGHSGAKGSTQLGWEEMDAPLKAGNWPVMSASATAWSERNQRARAMDRADMDRVRDQFVASAEMAARAGFDMLEIHCAHGYLLSSFITPLTNLRTDEYGGSLENRMRYPLEIFHAVRAVWPAEKPISVRISANDWVGADGIEPHDAVAISRMLQEAGVDICDVSAGQTSIDAQPVYGRMFQTPFSDRIRNETGMATMAVGNIFEPDHVNSILMAGRADLVCLARPHLADPYWTLHAAAKLGDRGETWPQPYYRRPRSALSALRQRRACAERRYDHEPRRQTCARHRRRQRHRRRHRAGAWRKPARTSRFAAGAGSRSNATAARHNNIHAETADVTDEESIAQLYEQAQTARGTFDIVVANAGSARERAGRENFAPSFGPRRSTSISPARSFRCSRRLPACASAAMGPHRLHRLDGRAEGLRLCRALCRRQARRRRPGARVGAGNRQGRHHRECGLSGLHRDAAARAGRRPHRRDDQAQRSRGARDARGQQSARPLHRSRRKSPTRCCGSAPTSSAGITGQAISVSGGETW